MKKTISLLSAALALALCACSDSPTGSDDINPNLSGTRLMKIGVTDPMLNNQHAFDMLVPKGWRYDAKVDWDQRFENLAAADVTIDNPNNGDLAEIYPFIPYAWNPNALIPLQPGTIYIGGYVMAPYYDPTQFIRDIVVPAFRNNVTGIQYEAPVGLAEVANAIRANYYNNNPNYMVTAGSIVAHYTLNNVRYEEKFFCVLTYATDPSLPGAVLWRPEFLYSLRSFEGGLASAEGLLQTCVTSITPDMKWFALYLQVHKQWQDGQMAAIKSAGDLSHYLSGVSASVDQTIIDGYNSQQASEDKVYDQFDQSIRGVQNYVNPGDNTTVELPSGYNSVWVNSSGEYFLSDQTGVNPNEGSTLTWTELSAE